MRPHVKSVQMNSLDIFFTNKIPPIEGGVLVDPAPAIPTQKELLIFITCDFFKSAQVARGV